ncbi:iron-sulfur cluster assembly protein NAR1 [Aspergillus clavatus NRRL 1]|uniref:Cytosolic Fe-S cluster assembly factor nar1 n=1 Tax=Aspergillus clavatus (strain ATCC 1007 / CBS 513.65 / DSM 816 / NCTC 3887 / NRRL 1 / QM 1276 / 107) TaxID=344612 RepID=NAR1_ASPCL|nr:iron-sulfur cluster assembly associated protein Nar1, putative [Aspergillus clavatus NRRL 1]A1CIC2.1 RecName: Full=Cytosolic Fe-S cluster assembly factor nar1; AltName: Full=Nuclear architecture-related protein 1 [Aspergillus clavatus NRRL 1]EAW10627.1 iron-sulfur cluster assembly associated protein Nar1, putative [Aspergillus clavatus NRRL 1]
MSAILSADDLNDFISPGVACIKPVETLPQKESQSENPYEVTKEDKIQPENLPPAQISLTDCLACSGCVTSAEAVLISLQSHAEVLNTLDAYPEFRLSNESGQDDIKTTETADSESRVFVASVSPQVRASLATTYGISEREAQCMIDQFLSGSQGLRAGGKFHNGFAWVVDTNTMREAVLALTADEVANSLTSIDPLNTLPKRPILSSACPGWICYAEKTHPFILPHLSRLKSPQALTGTLLKSVLSKALGISPTRIWHLAIMPCFDKKLEASREELTDSAWGPTPSEPHTPVRDVDCVITSRELLTLAASRGISLPRLPLKPLPRSYYSPFPDRSLDSFLFSKRSSGQTAASGTSGGYLHHVLTTFQAKNPGSQIVTQRGRNADVVEYVLMSPGGEPLLKAARYYGFRNIQNLVRKLKPARASRLPGARQSATSAGGSRRQLASRNAASAGSGTDYAYVEVMACPGGCTNGGGQVRIEDAREAASNMSVESQTEPPEAALKPTPHEQRAWLARVDEAYYSADSDSEVPATSEPASVISRDAEIHGVLQHWSEYMNIPLSKLAYTSYREVESDVGKTQTGPNDTARVVELASKIGGGW